MLIGEVKEITAARFGFRMIVKHLPGFPFMLAEDVHRRMNTAFAAEIGLWNAISESHLVAAATFGIDPVGIASIEAITLMVVTDRWIPIENRYEATLVDMVTKRGASFVKSLRYNLHDNQLIASFVLRREGGTPIAMYIVPENAEAGYRETLNTLITEGSMAAWIWDIRGGQIPDLPM